MSLVRLRIVISADWFAQYTVEREKGEKAQKINTIMFPRNCWADDFREVLWNKFLESIPR